jgi:protein dithiol:quinone oxidoreductase
MERTTYKNIQNGLLLFTILVLLFAFYLENSYNLEPCPLCLMQRFCVFLIGFLCFVGYGLRALHRARLIATIQVIVACLGLYFATRQLWLQSLPSDQAQMCMPGLDALVHYFSTGTIIKAFLWGSSDCSDVTWLGFGISMPGWATIYFSIMALINITLVVFLSQRLYKKTDSK